MEIILLLIGGFIGGFVFACYSDLTSKTYGDIYVDHDNNIYNVKITSEDLNNRKTKKAVFNVKHSNESYNNIDIYA